MIKDCLTLGLLLSLLLCALPASARAHLDGWVQDVSIRLAAVDAMQQLSAALN